MKNILYLSLILSLFLQTSCKEENIELIETETIIVQGYLFANHPVDSFRVTQSIGYYSTASEITTIDSLTIKITNGTDDFFLESIGAGYYQQPEFRPQAGIDYDMAFEYQGKTISSTTFIPEVKEVTISPTQIEVEKIQSGVMSPPTQTDPINVEWDNTEDDYYYVLVENIETTPEYINENLNDGDAPPRFRRLTEPEITSGYSIDPRREIQYFGTHQVIIYRVNPEYAALYNTGESTSSSLVEPPSNIENGLGIMTGVSTDTVYFEVAKF